MSCAAVATGVWERYPAPTPAPAPAMASTLETASHQLDRTVRSLVHSIRATCRNR